MAVIFRRSPFFGRDGLIFLIGLLLVINLVVLGNFLFQEIVQNRNENHFFTSINSQNLKIIFLNVGQGDAILIRTPKNQNILIDGGPDKGIIYKLNQYLPFYERKIDLAILTHPDPDHLNGLVEVLKRYQVNKIFFNGVKDESLSYLEFLKELEEKKIENEIVFFGKIFEFENGKIEFLYPLESLEGKSFKNDNEASLLFKFTYNEIKILFTGDATKKVEEELIKNNLDLKSDILKVAHHGSKDSTSLEFLERVKPSYAIISVGKNRFGHPSLRVLKNLEKVKAKILRTDQIGDIIFETDGKELRLKTQFK